MTQSVARRDCVTGFPWLGGARVALVHVHGKEVSLGEDDREEPSMDRLEGHRGLGWIPTSGSPSSREIGVSFPHAREQEEGVGGRATLARKASGKSPLSDGGTGRFVESWRARIGEGRACMSSSGWISRRVAFRPGS